MTKQVTTFVDTTQARVLILSKDDGSIACWIHDPITYHTWPNFSPYGVFECATRTIARLNNLTIVRNNKNCSMLGPCNYYGNLESAHLNMYTIVIENGVPIWYSHPVTTTMLCMGILPFIDNLATITWAYWKSGISYRNNDQTSAKARGSLFPNPGVLELDRPSVHLKSFDATKVNLELYGARLVNNSQPFLLTNKYVASIDDLRPVSYLFESGYAQSQMDNKIGMFVERHDFPQTMTPLDENCSGYVMLGRYVSETHMAFIAVQIPFGWTLIVDSGCIHGDTTLIGKYMMAMTTNHEVMNKADSVFIEDKNSRCVSFIHDTDGAPYKNDDVSVTYNNLTGLERINSDLLPSIRGKLIFNPFDPGYWEF